MAEFMQTDLVKMGKKEHRHIVLLQEQAAGQTSIDGKGKRDHAHDVEYNEEAEDWLVAEARGHTHTLEPVETNRPVKSEEDDDIVKDVIQLYKEAMAREKTSRERATESEEFYEGGDGQWSKDDRDKLDNEHRPRVTMNETATKVDLLSGYQSDNRTEIRFFPTEGGDQVVADALNVLVKNICYNNGYEHEETLFFDDLCIAGRGIMQLWVDRSRDIDGEIKIGRFPWDQAFYGPHSDPLARDAEYIGKHKWYSKAKVTQLWPKKLDALEAVFVKTTGADSDFETDDEPHHRREGSQYGANDNAVPFVTRDPNLINLARQDVKVIELQRKQYDGVYVLVNEDLDLQIPVFGWTDEQVAQAETINGFESLPREAHRMRVTRVAGNVLLDDEYPEDTDNFDLIMAYGKFRGKDWWSFVHGLKDPNRGINKAYSQYIDIITRVASYGWGYDEETFVDDEDAKKFITQSSTPGFVTRLKNADKPPFKFEGMQKPPMEIVQGLAMARDHLESLANVPPSLEALEKGAQSGAALIQKEKRGLIGNKGLFNAVSRVKQEIGRRLIKLIRQVYQGDPERILRVIQTERSRTPDAQADIGGKSLDEWDPTEIAKLLEEDELEHYDVVVSESEMTPTMRIANLHLWSTIAEHRPDLALDIIIELSNLPAQQKKRFREAQAAQAERQEKMEMMKYGVEKYKADKGAESRGQGGGSNE